MDSTPRARHLKTFTINLTDEQVAEKEKLLKEVRRDHPQLCPNLAELIVDFCVRHPEEATRIRETQEWEEKPSQHSPEALAKIFASY